MRPRSDDLSREDGIDNGIATLALGVQCMGVYV
jgi:hypothetical protein